MTLGSGSRIEVEGGQSLTLGKLLKSGGAGSIYLLPEAPALVAKIYHADADLALYERKLRSMLKLSPKFDDLVDGGEGVVQIAWPTAIVRDAAGACRGFLMPKLDIDKTIELEYMLQERQAKAAGLRTGLGQRMTLAANLAATIAELHRQGHYVVDLKPVNVRFYRRSLYLAMLDCDGFSIGGENERFPALQFTGEYLAPEFQIRGTPAIDEEQQDRFALAVVVFQLLNFGIHPFSGRQVNEFVPTDISARIAGHWYPFGLKPNRGIEASPASGHRLMPAVLRHLFDRAFAASPSDRPAAAEWSAVLGRFAQPASGLLVTCARVPQHHHYTGLACAACARDELLRTAGSLAVPLRPSSEPELAVWKTKRWQPRSLDVIVCSLLMLGLLWLVGYVQNPDPQESVAQARTERGSPWPAKANANLHRLLQLASRDSFLYGWYLQRLTDNAQSEIRYVGPGLDEQTRHRLSRAMDPANGEAEWLLRAAEEINLRNPEAAFELGVRQLLHMNRIPEEQKISYWLRSPEMRHAAELSFRAAVIGQPEQGANWYGLGVACMANDNITCATGAFMMARRMRDGTSSEKSRAVRNAQATLPSWLVERIETVDAQASVRLSNVPVSAQTLAKSRQPLTPLSSLQESAAAPSSLPTR